MRSMQIGKQLIYVVQTPDAAVTRCLLMTTDPGDLVLIQPAAREPPPM